MNDKDLRAFAGLNVAYDALLRAERELSVAGAEIDENESALRNCLWWMTDSVRLQRGNLGAYIAEFRDARAAAAIISETTND